MQYKEGVCLGSKAAVRRGGGRRVPTARVRQSLPGGRERGVRSENQEPGGGDGSRPPTAEDIAALRAEVAAHHRAAARLRGSSLFRATLSELQGVDRRHGLVAGGPLPELATAGVDDAVAKREAARRAAAAAARRRREQVQAVVITATRRRRAALMRRCVAAWARFPVVADAERRRAARLARAELGVLRMCERRRLDRLWDCFVAMARFADAMQAERERHLAAAARRRRVELEAKAALMVRRRLLTAAFDAWVLHHQAAQDDAAVSTRLHTRAERMAALLCRVDAMEDARRQRWAAARRHHAVNTLSWAMGRLRAFLHWRHLLARKAAWHGDLVVLQAAVDGWVDYARRRRHRRQKSHGFHAQRVLRRAVLAWREAVEASRTLAVVARRHYVARTTSAVVRAWGLCASRRAFIRAVVFRWTRRRALAPCFAALSTAMREGSCLRWKACRWWRARALSKAFSAWDAAVDNALAARYAFSLQRRRRCLQGAVSIWKEWHLSRRRHHITAMRRIAAKDVARQKRALALCLHAWRRQVPALREERDSLRWRAETFARVRSWLPPAL